MMLLLMFWGINYLKGKNLFTSSHTFYTTFRDVDGLKVSTEVLFRGMKVGSVTDISFNPEHPENLIVEFTVPKKYPVPNDSKITTHNTYVIGGKVLVIDYGRSPENYRNRDTIPSIVKNEFVDDLAGSFGSIKETASELVNNVSQTLESLNALLSEENIQSISGALNGLNRVISTDLRATVANLNSLTASLNNNSVHLDRIMSNVGDFSDSLAMVNLPELVDNINTTVLHLNDVVTKINEGDGSLSQLINDQELYDGLKNSSESLNSLLQDIQQNPKRYVHFSVFGRKN